MDKLENYIDWNDTKKYDKIVNNIPKTAIFIDLHFLRKHDTYPNAHKWSPCLNTQNGLWNVKLNRYANTKEKLKLQCFPIEFKNVVSKTQLHKQIGNSISVNVLKEIIINL